MSASRSAPKYSSPRLVEHCCARHARDGRTPAAVSRCAQNSPGTSLLSSTLSTQQILHDFPDLLFDGLDSAGAINGPHPVWFGRRNLLIPASDSLEEPPIGFFDAITHKRKGRLAGQQAFGADLWWRHYQQRQIRPGRTNRELNHFLDGAQIQF